MKRYNLFKAKISILVIILFVFQTLKSQTFNETVKPLNKKNWTGCVRILDGKYERLEGHMKVGKGSFYSFFRSYAVFDVSYIPDDAKIEEILLHLNTEMKAQLPDRKIYIYALTQNPINISHEKLFQSIPTNEPLVVGHDCLNTFDIV